MAKPVKTITGNDPNLAKAMAQMAGREPPLEEAMNKERQGWMQNQMAKAAAHMDRVLDTDEDLPLSRHIIMLVICGFFIVFFLWATFAKLEETTRGEGKIIPSKEVQKLSSLEGGIIKEVLIKEGDEVKAGQIVARLSPVAAGAELGSGEARYLGLMATVARLQAEVDGKPPEFPPEVMEKAPKAVSEELAAYRANQDKINGQTIILQQQKSQRAQELSELQIKSNDLAGQTALAREEKAMVEPLVARGSAPKMELLQIERTIKERVTEQNSVNSAIPRARAAIAEADARIKDLESTARATAQTELAAKIVEMEAIKKGLVGIADRKSRTEIKSPVNGYVKDVKVYTVGGVVQPGQDFIEIVPKDDQLLVEARIKPKDIAFLYPEQPAMVKISAYDFSIYGGLPGKVVGISPDAVTDEKGESFYNVRVLTTENALHRKDQVLPIIPGMVATVDILTGEKTVMEYILKPFVKTLNSSMNER
jgi:adhesin transport system membrane fusion protein